MNFPTAIKTCFRKYATFSGRASRSEYWWWLVFICLAGFILGVLSNMVMSLLLSAALIMNIKLLLCISLFVRRVHDFNCKGSFWVFLILLLPVMMIVCIEIAVRIPCKGFGCLGNDWLGGAIGLLLWMFTIPIAVGLTKGTPGPNRFGPDPLA